MTNGEIVRRAYENLGFSEDNYALTEPMLQRGLALLKQMVEVYRNTGILCYLVSDELDGDFTPPIAGEEPIINNLSVRLCPSLGMQPPSVVAGLALTGYQRLLIAATRPRKPVEGSYSMDNRLTAGNHDPISNITIETPNGTNN